MVFLAHRPCIGSSSVWGNKKQHISHCDICAGFIQFGRGSIDGFLLHLGSQLSFSIILCLGCALNLWFQHWSNFDYIINIHYFMSLYLEITVLKDYIFDSFTWCIFVNFFCGYCVYVFYLDVLILFSLSYFFIFFSLFLGHYVPLLTIVHFRAEWLPW